MKHIVWGLLLIIPFFYACKKDPNQAGINILDDKDLLQVIVDSSVQCKLTTEFDNEIRTTKYTYMLGNYTDPILGSTKSSFITRLYFDSLNFAINSTTILDSICLKMYDTSYYYGNASISQNIQIYEIQDSLTKEHFENYYSSASIPIDLINSAILIGEKSYKPNFTSVKGFAYTLPEQYSQDLFSRIQKIHSIKKSKTSVDSLLLSQFQGFYITSNTPDAAVVRYVSPQLKFYMHNDTANLTFSLLPSSTSYLAEDETDSAKVYMQSLSFSEHTFNQEITDVIGKPNSAYYVQGLAGLKTTLSLETLENWRDSLVIINNAQLIIPIQNLNETDFEYPPALNLRIYNQNKELQLTTLSVDFDSTQYVFNCQYFVTKLFNEELPAEDYIYEITVPDNNYYANRVILDGTDPEAIKFIITYTK